MTRKGQRLLYAGLQNMLSLVNDRYINTADVEMLIYEGQQLADLRPASQLSEPVLSTLTGQLGPTQRE